MKYALETRKIKVKNMSTLFMKLKMSKRFGVVNYVLLAKFVVNL
jgi:hypothetical protein